MLLRKLVIIFCPLLLCLLLCAVFGWLDGLIGTDAFPPYALKGLLLGACIGLMLPVSGITSRTNGLARWIYAAVGLLALLLTYQYLETINVVHWPVLRSLIPINGPVVLAESAVTGFLLVTAVINGRRGN